MGEKRERMGPDLKRTVTLPCESGPDNSPGSDSLEKGSVEGTSLGVGA